MVAFVLATARVASELMSVVEPWMRCMMKAPLSIPAMDISINSAWCEAGPGGVDVGVWVEDGEQVLPFSCLAEIGR